MLRRIARWRRTAMASVASGALAAALTVPMALATDQTVSISGFAFSPATVTVTEGDTVTWSNGDGVAHTATADDGSFDTGSIAGSASRGVTFDTAGTFAYHCSIHPSMTGTVVVAAAAASPSPSPSAVASPSASAVASPSPSAVASPTSTPTAPATDTDRDRSSSAGGDGPTRIATLLAVLAAAAGAGALLALRLRPTEAADPDDA